MCKEERADGGHNRRLRTDKERYGRCNVVDVVDGTGGGVSIF